MSPPGLAAELGRRRRRAAMLLRSGGGAREVARTVGASASSVSRWKRAMAGCGVLLPGPTRAASPASPQPSAAG